MTLFRKDVAAAALTIVVVLTYLATHAGWNVWLVGGSHRWAAGAILVLGLATCALGSPAAGTATKLSATLGVLALFLATAAVVSGALTLLSLLVLDIVVLWLVATVGHLRREAGRHVVV